VATIALTVSGTHLLAGERIGARLRREWNDTGDLSWMVGGAILATLAAVLIRVTLLHSAPLTDDEGAYQFGAQLLASGRLWVPSHPMKLFFDNAFFVNDGKYYPAYFWGWPALMAPGVWLGIPQFMNAVYWGLTLPAVFLSARHLLGSNWAKLTVLLVLASPMLEVLAATQMSQTSSIFALSWALYWYLRARDTEAGAWATGIFSICLCVSFFIRPISAVGFGTPLAVLWLVHLIRGGRPRLKRLAAFAIPAVVFALVFLSIQAATNGSPWKTGYARSQEYLIENDFRFSPFTQDFVVGEPVPGLSVESLGQAIGKTAGGLYRLNFDLLGWPVGLLLIGLAIGDRRIAPVWWMGAGGLLVLFFQHDAGIDTFGPVHFAEMALPAILVIAAFAARWTEHAAWSFTGSEDGRPTIDRRWRFAFAALLGSSVLLAWIGFVPVRWRYLERAARNIALPVHQAAEQRLHQAVVFVPYPYAPPCLLEPGRHFVFQHPMPDPKLTNDILWVNHVSLQQDREFMSLFPDRAGYGLRWAKPCTPVITPLDELSLKTFPTRPIRSPGQVVKTPVADGRK